MNSRSRSCWHRGQRWYISSSGQRSKTIASFTIIGTRQVIINRKRTEISVRVPIRVRSLTVILYSPFLFYFSAIHNLCLASVVRILQSSSSPPSMQKHKRHSGGILKTRLLQSHNPYLSSHFPLSYKSGDVTARHFYM